MNALVHHILRKNPRLTQAGAERLARKIFDERRWSRAEKKAKQTAAQLGLPLTTEPAPELDVPVDF